MFNALRRSTPLFAATLLLSSSLYAHEPPATTPTPSVTVSAAWVRAVPATSANSAAYMTLTNSATEEDHLVSAEATVSQTVELHNVRKNEGMMEMYQVKSIGIPAQGIRELRPGEYHVMLIGLKQPLKMDEQVTLKLNFMNAGAVIVQAPVREAMAPTMNHP